MWTDSSSRSLLIMIVFAYFICCTPLLYQCRNSTMVFFCLCHPVHLLFCPCLPCLFLPFAHHTRMLTHTFVSPLQLRCAFLFPCLYHRINTLSNTLRTPFNASQGVAYAINTIAIKNTASHPGVHLCE